MSEQFAIEPVVAGFFEAETTDLEITRDPGFAPTNIVDPGQPFDIALSFQGDPNGVVWAMLKLVTNGAPHVARIDYFAESMGPGANNVFLGTRNIVLNPARDIYGAHGPANENTKLTVSLPQNGVYRLAAQITFSAFVVASGFYEGTLISVR
ncbi:MAG: hypothetical protein L0226_08735 [Acidobacteria bacterium]|nr:hypothetical protein [Acidobacteriota bacterium]